MTVHCNGVDMQANVSSFMANLMEAGGGTPPLTAEAPREVTVAPDMSNEQVAALLQHCGEVAINYAQ